jgi:hypothetical protein
MLWVKTVKGDRPSKGEVAVEYLLTVITGFGVIAAVLFILEVVASGIGNVAPSQCSFVQGINCIDMVLLSNSTSTEFAMLGTNEQQYPITALSMNVGLNGVASGTQCTTGKILPGQQFVCFAKLKTFQKPGFRASGNLTANLRYCGFNGGNCAGAVAETYIGAYTSPTNQFTKPQVGIVLSPPRAMPNGSYAINASFNLFGSSLYLADITITPRPGAPPAVSYSGPGATSMNITVNTLANYCAGMINVTYANQTSIGAVALNATNYSGSSYKLSGNSNNNCLTLSPATKSVSVSGQNNTAGVFLLSNVTINVSSTGGHNDLAVFNSTATVKIAGNNNNVTMFDSNVVLYITGTYNQVKFINSRISNLTASGNNNLVVLINTTVAYENISGTNDIVQNG